MTFHLSIASTPFCFYGLIARHHLWNLIADMLPAISSPMASRMVQSPPLKPPASTPYSSAAPEQPFFAPPTPMEGSAFGLTMAPKGSVRLGQPVSLNVWIRNPETGRIPNKFEIVHEKP